MFKRIENFRDMVRGEKGFTLVELLVTVTIIGILAAIVTVGVTGAASTAQTKANQALYEQVQSGLDAYAASNPTTTGVPVVGATGEAASTSYYAASGSTGVGLVATDQEVNFASVTNNFNTFFRLGNFQGKCVVSSTSTFTLKACRN